MRRLCRDIRPRMLWPYRQMPEPQTMQQLANAPLVQVHRKHRGDLRPQIDPPPANHAIPLYLRAGAHPAHNLSPLLPR